mmetsp:Transcript_18314/g.40561  ORF Transcript_18314/g.40561 Transcript_18314/m.40561 type:complete len:88 (-) Transcript_18314:909-1172(-)
MLAKIMLHEEQLHRVSLRAVLPLKFPKLQLREIHSLEQLLARQQDLAFPKVIEALRSCKLSWEHKIQAYNSCFRLSAWIYACNFHSF